jgi:rod shape-determining protein MreC
MLEMVPSRIRPVTLLAAVLVAQVLLLAFQIRRAGTDVRLIREWTVLLVTPFQRAGSSFYDRVRGTWTSYVDLRHAQQENSQLRAELSSLKLRAFQLESRAAEATRLATLLEFRNAHPEAELLIARVIGSSAAGASRTVYISRGTADGVKKNMAVITPDGVVGKVLDAYGETSQVLLLTDKESGVGALLASSRAQGVVRGAPEAGQLPSMDYVSKDTEVGEGERILTSGQDRIFPKDLPVGTVAEVSDTQLFKRIRVRPAAGLDRLEEVIVLLTRQELAAKAEAKPEDKPAAKSAATTTEKRQ